MTDAEMESPPRPRRVIGFDVNATPHSVCPSGNKDHITKESKDTDVLMRFEDGLVDKAVSDLPNIASQVFSLNKNQNSEINRQQQHLTLILDKVKEGEEKVNEIELEIKCVMNRMCITDEECIESNKRIKTMDSEIKALIWQVIDKEKEVSHLKDKADIETRNLDRELEKVAMYRENVEQYEQGASSIYRDVQKIEGEIAQLKKQKDIMDKDVEATERFLSGVVEKERLSEIEGLKSQLLQEGDVVKQNIDKLSEERKKHKQLKQTIQVLHKRNTAQMTRLKRQLKELQTRNRQKQNQLTLLQVSMTQAEEKLMK